MDTINYVDKQGNDYFPTPDPLAEKLVDCVDWNKVTTVLEPSAGQGSILKLIAKKINHLRDPELYSIDCIEIDPDLREALNYNFSEKGKAEIEAKKSEIALKYGCIEKHWGANSYYYVDKASNKIDLPDSDQDRLHAFDVELKGFFKSGIHIVHDDFLTYSEYKKYDLIIMAPPSSEGSKHLLKALNMQKNGGCVVCLLRADILKNPQTEEDKLVSELLTKYTADIEYTNQMAIIKVNIPENDSEPSLFDIRAKMNGYYMSSEEPVSLDFIQEAITRYKSEVEAGIDLIRSYHRMLPYLNSSFDKKDPFSKDPIIGMTNGEKEYGSENITINMYVKSVRRKYWQALLANQDFVGKLTSRIQNEYRDKIHSFSEYDFSEFNIRNLIDEINCQTKSDIKDEILKIFDSLTANDRSFTECEKNKIPFLGWNSSNACKIGKKSIVPCQVFSGYDGTPKTYNLGNLLIDIERTLNILRGKTTADIDISERIDRSFSNNNTKNISCRFFDVTFYKKGTVHITFTCPELIDRFNIYAARHKGWLPPSYGKKQYKDLTKEEKEVIDSFQGKEAYNKVLANPDIYLASPTDGIEQYNPFKLGND